MEKGPKIWRGSDRIRITYLIGQYVPKLMSCIKFLITFPGFLDVKIREFSTIYHKLESIHYGLMVCKHVNMIHIK